MPHLAGKQADVCLTLMDLMLRDLLQKMFWRTSRLETQARSSHPGSSSLGGGGPGGNARTVDCVHRQETDLLDRQGSHCHELMLVCMMSIVMSVRIFGHK